MDKISSFSFFSNDVGLKESPRAVPDLGTLLGVLSPDMFCFVVLFLFPRSYSISFQIYLFICLSVCLMVAMSYQLTLSLCKHTATGATVRFAFIPTNLAVNDTLKLTESMASSIPCNIKIVFIYNKYTTVQTRFEWHRMRRLIRFALRPMHKPSFHFWPYKSYKPRVRNSDLP